MAIFDKHRKRLMDILRDACREPYSRKMELTGPFQESRIDSFA